MEANGSCVVSGSHHALYWAVTGNYIKSVGGFTGKDVWWQKLFDDGKLKFSVFGNSMVVVTSVDENRKLYNLPGMGYTITPMDYWVVQGNGVRMTYEPGLFKRVFKVISSVE